MKFKVVEIILHPDGEPYGAIPDYDCSVTLHPVSSDMGRVTDGDDPLFLPRISYASACCLHIGDTFTLGFSAIDLGVSDKHSDSTDTTLSAVEALKAQKEEKARAEARQSLHAHGTTVVNPPDTHVPDADVYDESKPFLGLSSLRKYLDPASFVYGFSGLVFQCLKTDEHIAFSLDQRPNGGHTVFGTVIPLDSPTGKWLKSGHLYYFTPDGHPVLTLAYDNPAWSSKDPAMGPFPHNVILNYLNKDNPTFTRLKTRP